MMRKTFALLLLSALSIACRSGGDAVAVNAVDSSWPSPVVQRFTLEVKDAGTPKNIIFVVRNNNDYPYSNLFLITDLHKTGENRHKTDTLNYVMARPDGAWLGQGFGKVKEIDFLYRHNFVFPSNGTYILDIRHGMRQNPLPGIEDIGLKIESVKP